MRHSGAIRLPCFKYSFKCDLEMCPFFAELWSIHPMDPSPSLTNPKIHSIITVWWLLSHGLLGTSPHHTGYIHTSETHRPLVRFLPLHTLPVWPWPLVLTLLFVRKVSFLSLAYCWGSITASQSHCISLLLPWHSSGRQLPSPEPPLTLLPAL